MKTLHRIMKSGFKNFYRNGLLSASSVLVIVITLMIGSSVYLGGHMLNASIKQIEKKVDVNIYLKTEALESDILLLKEEIEALPELQDGKVEYQTKEDVKSDFESKGQKKETIEALSMVGNPFGAVLNISANSVNDYETIDSFIFSREIQNKYGDIVESSNYKDVEGAVEKLKFLIKYFNQGGIIFSIILALIAFLVTYNTLRLVMHSKKEEIAVMKLVGASNFFAKGPFVFSGMLYGFVGGVITIILVSVGVAYAGPVLNQAFIFNLEEFYAQNIWIIGFVTVLSGMFIGFISSYIAATKYVKI